MASKSKSRRRVLRASCLLAALIVAGSSFAWFTSKDEVTNRLSATADYDVAIAEDFTPPEKWVPGQQINKDVAVTNTGNIDAFARVWLTGEMRVLQTTPAASSGTGALTLDNWSTTDGKFADTTTALLYNNDNSVEDSELVKMGLTKFTTVTNDEPRYYFKMLSKTSTKNPEDNQQSNKQNDYKNEKNTDYYSEVQAMQAGGILAYAPDDAEYTYVLNQETELPIYSKTTTGTGAGASTSYSTVTRKVPAGTRVYVTKTTPGTDTATWCVDTASDMSNVKTVWVPAQSFTATGVDEDDHFNPVNVDVDSFQPLTPGLYLFARNIDLKNPVTDANDYEFSGYYYSDYNTVITDNNGTTSMEHTQYATSVAQSKTTDNGGTAWVSAADDTLGQIADADGGYGKGTYYALKAENDISTGDNRSDYTVPTNAVTVEELDNDLFYINPTVNLELYTAAYEKIDADSLKWRVGEAGAATSGTDIIYAIYDKDGGNDFDKAEDIVIEIGVANLGTTGQTWMPMNSATAGGATGFTDISGANETTDASKLTFYYNDDIESGDTTAKLVDYVKLSDRVTNQAYLAFDFDLNVNMESMQVTYAEDGKEKTTPVNTWAATTVSSAAVNTGAKPNETNDSGNEAAAYSENEITTVGWTALS